MNRRTVNTAEAELAYYIAARVAGLAFSIEQLRALAAQTHEVADASAAADAVREAAARTANMLDVEVRSDIAYEATLEVLKTRGRGRANTGNA